MIVKELIAKLGFEIDSEDLDKFGEEVDGVKGMLLKAGIAVVGFAAGILEGVRSTAEFADQLGKSAALVGLSSDEFQKYQYAAKMSGVANDDFRQSVQMLSKNVAEAATGNKGAADAFTALGISVRDSSGNLKSNDDILGELSNSFQKIQDPALRTKMAMDIFGRSGARMGVFLSQGSAAIGEAKDELEKLGGVLSEEVIEQSAELNDNMDRLAVVGKAVKNSVAAAFLPVINDIVVSFRQWILANSSLIKQNLTGFIKGISAVIKEAWVVIKAFINVVDSIVQSFGGWERVIKVVGFLVAAMIGASIIRGFLTFVTVLKESMLAMRALGVAAAITNGIISFIPILIASIVLAIGLFIEDIYSWINGQNSLTGSLIGPWVNYKETILDLWSTIKDALSSGADFLISVLRMPWDIAVAAFNFFYNLVTGNFDSLSQLFSDLGNQMASIFEAPFLAAKNFFGFIGSGFDKVKGLFSMFSSNSGAPSALGNMAALASPENNAATMGGGAQPIDSLGTPSRGSNAVTQNNDIKTNVSIQVPVGTSDEQVKTLDFAARKAVDDQWDMHLRNVMNSMPALE